MDFYIDGACSGNPGPGGWAILKINNDTIVDQVSGYEDMTTNNRMEMTAFIFAMDMANDGDCIYTDSMYVVNCYNNYEKWLLKKNIPNTDLVNIAIDKIKQKKGVHLLKVIGHTNDKYNIMVDKLAVLETKKSKK